jgi:hypothetical protein
VDLGDAAKLAIGAGTVAGGVAMAVTGDVPEGVVEKVADVAQEMFVGNPAF